MAEASINPYTPPVSDLTPAQEVNFTQPDASSGLRFFNYLISLVACFILNFFIFRAIYRFAPSLGDQLSAFLPQILWGYLITVLYHFLNELCGGRGISKLITGTRAEMEDGSPLKIRSALTRSLCRIIPFEPFSFLGRGTGGWHDSLTGTRVVNVRATPVQRFPGFRRRGNSSTSDDLF